ncbi:hypothetical protein HUG10_01365 [Halorarum halophilum]|uniref:DUF7993 domain-containing protein n=1 Tax=Halorarum halophilum TaxID=2743090 RepID=A0A7D5GDM4_9EURY|nr:hypothetical protein [Halobaculum halophilum]QLG26270.1 hypothetical protein HUG10_01365 [Halobaculum halophilum]
MVEDRTADGVRIAQLLASELTGGGGRLADVTVTDSAPDVEPTTDGALAYGVAVAGADGRGEPDYVAEVYVHPDRVRAEFRVAPDAAADAGAEAGLRVRPKAVRPPRTIVFVEDGAEVKRVLPVFETAVRAVHDGSTGRDGDGDE